jgi:Tfp pilus assembly protein PilF
VILIPRGSRGVCSGVINGQTGLVAGGLIVAVVAVVEWLNVASKPASKLAPDPALVRYRHALDLPDSSDDLCATIAALETRMREGPNPFDAAELAELYYRRAQREGDRRDFAASEAMAKRSLAMLKAPNSARLTLAKLANARHEFRRAIEIAREYSKSKKSSSAYQVIATAYLALGEVEAAVEAADDMVAIRRDSGSHLMRALTLEAAGRDVEAAFDFGRAARLEHYGDKFNAARLRALWGRFLFRRGEYEGAALLFDEASRIVPRFPQALAGQAELAMKSGDPKKASALFEEAFISSRRVRYLIDRARALELSRDHRGARELRIQAERLLRRELEEDGLGHRLELVELLIDRGGAEHLEEAVKLANAELTQRSSAEVRHQLARGLKALEEIQ